VDQYLFTPTPTDTGGNRSSPIWACPSFTGRMYNGGEWYGTRGYSPQIKVMAPTAQAFGSRQTEITEPGRVPLVAEWRNYVEFSRWWLTTPDAHLGIGYCSAPLARFDHRNGMNILFCDGHVSWLPPRPEKWADTWCGGELPGIDNPHWYP
jgi:prepilin-type processing-associated H-X9-DG protein